MNSKELTVWFLAEPNMCWCAKQEYALQWYDANISLPGCDKNMPGVVIAMARLNRPALMVYGGTIKPGYSGITNKPIDVVSAFQSYGVHAASHASTMCSSHLLRATRPVFGYRAISPALTFREPLTAYQGPWHMLVALSHIHSTAAQAHTQQISSARRSVLMW